MKLEPTIMCPNAPDHFRVDVAGTKGTLTISREQLTPEMKDELAAEWRKKLDQPITTTFRGTDMTMPKFDGVQNRGLG